MYSWTAVCEVCCLYLHELNNGISPLIVVLFLLELLELGVEYGLV